MKVVYKYYLSMLEAKQVEVSIDSKVVLVGVQKDRLCIWIETNIHAWQVERKFEVYGTGLRIYDRRNHVGSFQDGEYVWHVYEVMEK